ncbi:malonyl-ACP O-methyltransferase BioC [Thermithiobacillus plumbiphilus]|uniref:Malonyl-[acyl-carrier protein] O-methyltransferase n=1 Tax=Thermithiobacillus plumbiphilus TaxID=1729899 RepID=A0ABU9DBK2_9PROT
MMENPLNLIDKQAARRAFNRAAITYEAAAVLQREVADRLLERLDLVKLDPAWILDAGSGTGYACRRLNKRYPKAQVVALDFAESMLQQARKGRGWFARQQFVCGDLEALPFQAQHFDLVFSNFSLQWCNDLDAVFSGFRHLLKPGGLLMFTTFGPDTLRELRQVFAEVAPGQPHVSDFVDMHDIGDALVRQGFEIPVMDVEHFTLTYAELRALMQDIKAIGAQNATAERARGLLSPARWRALNSAYESFRREGRLPATYEVVYGHAWASTRPENRTLDDGSIAVPLSQLRRR